MNHFSQCMPVGGHDDGNKDRGREEAVDDTVLEVRFVEELHVVDVPPVLLRLLLVGEQVHDAGDREAQEAEVGNGQALNVYRVRKMIEKHETTLNLPLCHGP